MTLTRCETAAWGRHVHHWRVRLDRARERADAAHYDALGLLRPAYVDDRTNYRFYEASQLATLGRIVALRDLGLRLDQIGRIVKGQTGTADVIRVLERRRAELAGQIDADRSRMARIEERLHLLRGERAMSATNVELKAVPPVWLHEATAPVPGGGPENVGPVIGPLYQSILAALGAAGVPPREPSIAYYTSTSADDGAAAADCDSGLAVHAGFVAEDGDPGIEGVETVELPGERLMATLVHHGAMAKIGDSWAALTDWLDANGYRPAGVCREVYLRSMPHPQEDWVTELQWPVERSV